MTAPAPEALKRLKDGNARYVAERQEDPNRTASRRQELKKGQAPFAVILSCADSRVAPEILFDQGLGDLFVVRVAGNIAGDKVLGSIEYAVHHLGTKLVVVMGHESCGAVGASLTAGPFDGHIGTLIEHIKPAVYLARTLEGDELENATKLNAKMVAEGLKDTVPILKNAVDEGGLQVVPAYYHLEGNVEFLCD